MINILYVISQIPELSRGKLLNTNRIRLFFHAVQRIKDRKRYGTTLSLRPHYSTIWLIIKLLNSVAAMIMLYSE